MAANMYDIEVHHTYPEGSYYIGDVCYAFDKEVYEKQWQDKYKFARGTLDITNNNITSKFSVNSTAFGDGLYMDDVNGLQFPVDSGTIGIIPLELCSKSMFAKDGTIKGGHIIKSSTDIEFRSNKGIFVIGYNDNTNMIIIDTEDNDECE